MRIRQMKLISQELQQFCIDTDVGIKRNQPGGLQVIRVIIPEQIDQFGTIDFFDLGQMERNIGTALLVGVQLVKDSISE
jgi:hypothetical protein